MKEFLEWSKEYNRMRPPQPVVPWSGVRDALTFGHEPPQLHPAVPQMQAFLPDPAIPGEDCLNLNIWTPETGPALGTDPPQKLADAMHSAWVAFATNRDCGWPKYNHKRRATIRFDTRSEVMDDPRSAERTLWEGRRNVRIG